MSIAKKLLGVAVLGALSTGALAQEEGITLGAKLAFDVSVDTDFGDFDGDGFGINAGYGFGNGVSAEIEFISGEIDDVDADFDLMAIYGTYRSNGDAYFLGKLGYADGELETLDDTGLSYGIGGGYRFNEQFSVEGEYTMFDFDDIDADMIAIGARYHF